MNAQISSSCLEDANIHRQCLQSKAHITPFLQHIQDSGVPEGSLDESLKERIEEAQELEMHDEEVASVLLVSLMEEAQRMRADVRSQERDIKTLNSRSDCLTRSRLLDI